MDYTRLRGEDCGSRAKAPIDGILLTDCGLTKEERTMVTRRIRFHTAHFELQNAQCNGLK
jgi:hypothetical protein